MRSGSAFLGAARVTWRIRRCRRADIPQIARLYYDTVHNVNARDYSPRQNTAWAPYVFTDAFWQRRFQHYTVFVAEDRGQVVGFAELGADGHIDCFHVHHRRQGQGVGGSLMRRIEQSARRRRITCLHADVSITARRFFRSCGFDVVRRQKKVYHNCVFRQYQMAKQL